MIWKEFKDQLTLSPEMHLQFKYEAKNFVDASYHITEIKQAPITSVDCGGVVNEWAEIIIQLWEPQNQGQAKPMQVKKALSIIEVVESKLFLNPVAIVKVEFGNSGYSTRQMLPHNLVIDGENLVVDLCADTVQCKAINRGGSCGAPNESSSKLSKTKIELKNLAATEACCTPGGGCC